MKKILSALAVGLFSVSAILLGLTTTPVASADSGHNRGEGRGDRIQVADIDNEDIDIDEVNNVNNPVDLEVEGNRLELKIEGAQIDPAFLTSLEALLTQFFGTTFTINM